MEIRNATIKDVDELALLMEQIGYPTTNEKIGVRFIQI